MKVRDIENRIWKRHILADSRNRRARLKMLRSGRGTEEQLELARVCEKLDRYFMKYATRQL